MYEEDRQTALAMYNRLFDEVGDEQGLLQLLVSPTRQAVVIARSYNAKERKLQVHSQSREEAGDEQSTETPQFVSVIEGIRAEALSRQTPKTAEISADQFSMFEDDFFAPAPEKPDADAPAENETPESAAEADAVEAQPEEAEPQKESADDAEKPAAEAEAEPEPEAEAAPEQGDAPAEPAPQEEAPGKEPDAVDAFLADFEIVDHDEAEKTAVSEAEPAPAADEYPAEDGEQPAEDSDAEQDYDYDYEYDEEDVYTVRKPRVFLLILYILLAIPVGLIGILALSLLMLVFLALAAGFIAAGIVAVTTAFGGLPLFADIIVAIGAAFVLLALGLLALWTAIWIVGGLMVGLVKGLIHLGGRWCYKEVEA